MFHLRPLTLLPSLVIVIYILGWFYYSNITHSLQLTNRERGDFVTDYQEFDLDTSSVFTRSRSPFTQRLASPKDHVLILTPLMESVQFLDGYFASVSEIDYPKDLISLGFFVSTRTRVAKDDPTLVRLRSKLQRLSAKGIYRRITLIYQPSKAENHDRNTRHAHIVQPKRRRILADCRNTLLAMTLSDESWVLWLDVDVIRYSPQLLTRLMRFGKDIVVPNCFKMEGAWWRQKPAGPYDRNNWSETMESLAQQRVLDADEILFEGYPSEQPTFRQSMADLGDACPELVELDGVGGTFTLVKAVIHLSGITFPLDTVDHQIETEGFAKWAKLQGFTVFGAPHLFVYHI